MRKLWSIKHRAIKKLKMKISKHLKVNNLEQPNILWMLMLLCCLWHSKMVCTTLNWGFNGALDHFKWIKNEGVMNSRSKMGVGGEKKL
jgi:hypothetical protein